MNVSLKHHQNRWMIIILCPNPPKKGHIAKPGLTKQDFIKTRPIFGGFLPIPVGVTSSLFSMTNHSPRSVEKPEKGLLMLFESCCGSRLPSRKLTYPTLGKPENHGLKSAIPGMGYVIVPWGISLISVCSAQPKKPSQWDFQRPPIMEPPYGTLPILFP